MRKWLQMIPLIYLVPVAVLLGLMPVSPEPHLIEKLRLLGSGKLTRPIDIFDLVLHGAPLLLVALKIIVGRDKQRAAE